jgi:hypothetical protein
VAADRVHLRDDCDVESMLGRFNGSAHPCKTAANYNDIVLDHFPTTSCVMLRPSL